jgi:hypothetical protein
MFDESPPSPPVDPPHLPNSSHTSENAARFPDCVRLDPPRLDFTRHFAERWQAKERDFLDFVVAREQANVALVAHGILGLPAALEADWQASWAEDIFKYILPVHVSIQRDRVPSAVADLGALVDAIQFVHPRCCSSNALRFWAYILPYDPGFDHIPTVDEIKRYCPNLDPRPGDEDWPATRSLYGHLDQRQFFERSNFLLGKPTDADWHWLRRLAYRTDPHQPIWCNGLPFDRWKEDFRTTVPVLSSLLDIDCDPRIVDETTDFAVLLMLVRNWCRSAREAVRRAFQITFVRTPTFPINQLDPSNTNISENPSPIGPNSTSPAEAANSPLPPSWPPTYPQTPEGQLRKFAGELEVVIEVIFIRIEHSQVSDLTPYFVERLREHWKRGRQLAEILGLCPPPDRPNVVTDADFEKAMRQLAGWARQLATRLVEGSIHSSQTAPAHIPTLSTGSPESTKATDSPQGGDITLTERMRLCAEKVRAILVGIKFETVNNPPTLAEWQTKIGELWKEARSIPLSGGNPIPEQPGRVVTMEDVRNALQTLLDWVDGNVSVGKAPGPDAPPPKLPSLSVDDENKKEFADPFASAKALANEIDKPLGAVETFLTRFARTNKDCRIDNPNPRSREPLYLYRRSVVMPALCNHFGL